MPPAMLPSDCPGVLGRTLPAPLWPKGPESPRSSRWVLLAALPQLPIQGAMPGGASGVVAAGRRGLSQWPSGTQLANWPSRSLRDRSARRRWGK